MAVFVLIVLIYYFSDCLCPLAILSSTFELLNKTIDGKIFETKKTKTTYKSNFLLKVFIEELTGTWEGGVGVEVEAELGNKKSQNKM